MAREKLSTVVEGLYRRQNPESPINVAVDILPLDMMGIAGPGKELDNHRGPFLRAGTRDMGFKRRGPDAQRALKFNHRQVSIIGTDSLDHIGDALDIDPDIVAREFGESRDDFLARHLGVNVLVGPMMGATSLNDVRPSYHIGPVGEDGNFRSSLLIISYNEPCTYIGKALAEVYPGTNEGMPAEFMRAAKRERGYVGVVSMAGHIGMGDELIIEPLPQRPEDETAA